MKKSNILFLSLIAGLFVPTLIIAQPLNNSFEDWTMGEPNNWFTSDIFGLITGVSESSDAHDGNSSAELTVVDFGGSAWPPFLISMDGMGNGHPVSQQHGSLQGWYKFNPTGGEWLYVTITMTSSDSTAVGAGGIIIMSPASGWTQFTAPIAYFTSDDPVETYIYFALIDSNGTGTVGSSALIDHLSFTGPSSVEQIDPTPEKFTLKQNFPNPFNPKTTIEYSLPEASFVELKIYNILGNEISTLVNQEQSAGVYRSDFTAENLASGFYIARLRVGENVKTIKMTLMK